MGFIFAISFIALIVGLFNPSIIRAKNKKTVFLFLLLWFVCLFFAGVYKASAHRASLTPEQRAQEDSNRLVKKQMEKQAELDKDDICLNPDPRKFDMILLAQNSIKQKLKNPNGAEFQPVSEITLIQSNDQNLLKKDHSKCAFIISSWVDATNSFGATIRNNWIAEIHSDGIGARVSYTKLLN